MAVLGPKYSLEEFARRGTMIYDRDIKPVVEPKHNGEMIAIDIETGTWEVDADEMVASDRLRARIPDAQIWMTRAGYGYIRRFGGGKRHQ